MKLKAELILNILEAFEEHPDTFMPIPLVAKKVNDSEYRVGAEGESSHIAISPTLVFHLLHLQDLEAIMNMHGEHQWSYNPTGNANSRQLNRLVEKSLEEGEFSTPHSYDPYSENAIIRLTATGMQMRSALQSSLENKIKKAVIEFGKLAIPAALSGMVG